MTCRHFRYEVPREYADELRDADPEPCPVCDALPHRKALTKAAASTPVQTISAPSLKQTGWLVKLFSGKSEEIVLALPTARGTA